MSFFSVKIFQAWKPFCLSSRFEICHLHVADFFPSLIRSVGQLLLLLLCVDFAFTVPGQVAFLLRSMETREKPRGWVWEVPKLVAVRRGMLSFPSLHPWPCADGGNIL